MIKTLFLVIFLLICPAFGEVRSTMFTSIVKMPKYDKEKALLGKALFSDIRLSTDKKTSCEMCHNIVQNKSLTSNNMYPNPPTLLNAYYNFLYSFDGSQRDLKIKIEDSFLNPTELGSSKKLIIERIEKNPNYKFKFNHLYGEVTFENVVDSIYEFIKALVTPLSKFDMYLDGNETALNSDEKKGFDLFIQYGCSNCHNGINIGGNIISRFLSTDKYHKILIKVPTLRNIAITTPYFHDGSKSSLYNVIQFADKILVRKHMSNEEYEYLHKFFLSLTGQTPEILYE